MKNSVTEIKRKYTTENSSLEEAEEWISVTLEDRVNKECIRLFCGIFMYLKAKE